MNNLIQNKIKIYKSSHSININEFMKFIDDNNLNKYAKNIYTYEQIDSIIKSKIKTSTWNSIHYLLNQISSTEEKYYYMDSHNSFKNINRDVINSIIKKIEKDLTKKKNFEKEM